MDELPPLIPITGRKMDELPSLIPITSRNVHSWTLSYSIISAMLNMTLSVIYIATISNSYDIAIYLIIISCLSLANFLFFLNIDDWYRSFVCIISIDIIRACLVIYVFIVHMPRGPLLMSNFPIIVLITIENRHKFDANKHLYSLQV
jgi:hypothetical protein